MARRVVIRNHSAEANLFARRTFIAFVGVLVLLLILFSNLYSLQIASFEKYQTRSNSNRIKLLPVAPNRGLIYDRNGVILADNKPIYSLAVIPEETKDIENSIAQISQLLDIVKTDRISFLNQLKVNDALNKSSYIRA